MNDARNETPPPPPPSGPMGVIVGSLVSWVEGGRRVFGTVSSWEDDYLCIDAMPVWQDRGRVRRNPLAHAAAPERVLRASDVRPEISFTPAGA